MSDVIGLTEKRLREARLNIYENTTFFGHLVDHLSLRESERVPTAGIETDGTIHYNTEFVDSLNTSELEGLLTHEVMHVALRGEQRKGSRDHRLWNIAQDAIINHQLVEAGFDLPDCGIIPVDGEITLGGVTFDDLDNESFETVYARLDREAEKVTVEGFDEHVVGENGGQGEAAVDAEEKDWEKIVDRAESAAKASDSTDDIGDSPGGAKLTVSASEPGMVDYRRYVKRKLGGVSREDYTYRRPDKRSQAVGSYLPTVKQRSSKLNVVALLDTSGSIDEDDLSQFASELGEIVSSFDRVRLYVIQHDVDVQSAEEVDDPSEREFESLEITGRGGTDHNPSFEFIDEELDFDPHLVVSYTDGYSSFPDESPVPTAEHLWVLTQDSTKSADEFPFGAVSRLDR